MEEERDEAEPSEEEGEVSEKENITENYNIFAQTDEEESSDEEEPAKYCPNNPGKIEKIVLEMTNKEGRRVHGDNWKKMDQTDLQGYLGLLILACVYWSTKEAMSSLWHSQSGRAVFHATKKNSTSSQE